MKELEFISGRVLPFWKNLSKNIASGSTMSPCISPKLSNDATRYLALTKLVLTRFKTAAEAYASPVRISMPPFLVEVAVFSPVEARTSTSLVTSATFLLRTLRFALLRHVRTVQPSCVGEAPTPPCWKYERSKARRSRLSPFCGLRKSTRPLELKKLVLTTFKTRALESAVPV